MLASCRNPDVVVAVRVLLAADSNHRSVEDGFGLGVLQLLSDTDDNTEDVLPASIGPYRILRVAGSGATALVYEAMEAVPRRRVAVKVARASLDPDLHHRFEEEAHALSRVRHPAVPVVYQVGQCAGLPWLSTEWLEGEPLHALQGDVDVQTWIDVANGLGAAHAAGVAHGDVSPGNILITADGPKVVDFGHANAEDAPRSAGGTPGFVAPSGCTPVEADQYALGCVIAARTPPDSVLGAIAQAAKDRRYEDMAALAADLTALRNDQPVSVLSDPAMTRLRRWTRHHRRLWGGALVGISVTAVVLGGIETVRQNAADRVVAATQMRAQADLERVRASHGDVDAQIADYIADPRWAGTPAMSDAWLTHAEGLSRAGDAQRSTDALATAFVTAKRPDQRHRAAQQLADRFIVDQSWTSLHRLAARYPTAEGDRWRQRAAAGVRDLRGAAAAHASGPLATLLSTLSDATPTAHQASFVQSTPTPGRLLVVDQEAGLIAWTDTSASLAVQHQVPLPPGERPHAFEGRWLHVNLPGDQATLYNIVERQGTLALVDPVGLPRALQCTATFGERADETVFAGFGYPTRDLRDLTRDLRPVHRSITAVHSDVDNLLPIPDGPGSPWLIGAFGPWLAYDLRTFRVDGHTLELVDRVELGSISGLASFTEAGQRWVVATKSDRYRNPDVLGPSTPFGAAAGIYLWPLTVDGLGEPLVIPTNMAKSDRGLLTDVFPGDFDGDGVMDLAVNVSTPAGSGLWIVRRDGAGDYDDVLLDKTVALWAGNLDDDAADELVIRTDDRSWQTWTLGAGSAEIPGAVPIGAPPDSDGSTLPPAVRELVDLGLDRAAASLAEQLAGANLTAAHGTLFVQAGGLWHRAGERHLAEVALRHALDSDPSEPLRVDILESIAALQLDGFRMAEARETVQSLPAHRQSAWLAKLPSRADFPEHSLLSRPSLAGLTIDAPDAIRTPVTADTLYLDMVTGTGRVVTQSLRWTQDKLRVSVTLDIDRLELGSGAQIDLVSGGVTWLHLKVWGNGGGRWINLIQGCLSKEFQGFHITPVSDELTVGQTVTLSAFIDRSAGTVRCEVSDLRGLQFTDTWNLAIPEEEELDLVMSAIPVTSDRGTRGQLRVRDLTVSGAQTAPPVDDPIQRAHHRYLLGDYAVSAKLYADNDAPQWQALALLDGGQLGRARPWFEAHPDAPLTQRLHRTRPEIGGILAAHDPLGYPARLQRDLASGARYTQAQDVATLLMNPALDGLGYTIADACSLTRYRAQTLAQQGRYGPALATLDALMHTRETDTRCAVRSYVDAAVLLVRAGRTDDAEARLNGAIALSATPDLTLDRLRHHPVLQGLAERLSPDEERR